MHISDEAAHYLTKFVCISFHSDGEDEKEDASVKLVAAGGNGFKTMATTPKLRGIAR